MTSLLLRLAGPLQAWGDSSRFARRETRAEPTKSGVIGLLSAAQGRRRTDSIEDLAGLRFGVRVDQPGRLMRDFQTAIRWGSVNEENKSMPLSYRYYLQDALFVVALEADEELLLGLEQALLAPVYPLYLGRRSCPVEGQLTLGLVPGRVEEALREAPWQAALWHRRRLGKSVDLELVVDADPSLVGQAEVIETVRDLPISFSPERREHGWRDVVRPRPHVVINEEGTDEVDFLAALGGQ